MLKKTASHAAIAVWCFFLIVALAQDAAKTAAAVVRVYAGSDGSAHITDANGNDAAVPKEPDQVDISRAAIASDQHTAGWLAEFPNADTTYPIALSLIVYRSGKIKRFGDGMLIVNWMFLVGGRQIAFYSNTVHSGLAPHRELRDVQSGRLLGKWDGPLNAKAPRWALALED